MLDFLTQHGFWTAVTLYWIFSAAVSSMPEPSPTGGQGYNWIYRFLHTLAGNLTTAVKGKIPGTMILLLLMIPFCLTWSACTARYTVHPGALNRTDSIAYDALQIAQATIDQARTAYQSGQLSGSAKEPLNALIRSYNVARDSWLIYRGAVATNSPPDTYIGQLINNIVDLTEAIRAFKEAKWTPN